MHALPGVHQQIIPGSPGHGGGFPDGIASSNYNNGPKNVRRVILELYWSYTRVILDLCRSYSPDTPCILPLLRKDYK
jgi:hypothetical protein